MKAPLKVLICWLTIAVVLVVVVFYRYDLISGIKRTILNSSESPASAPAAPAESSTMASAPAPTAAAPTDAPKTVANAGSADLENGKKLYLSKTCTLCHGDSGKADTVTGQSMGATNLVAGKFKKNTANLEPSAYILKVLEEGVPGTAMMSFKAQIPDEKDRKDLAAYVHSLVK